VVAQVTEQQTPEPAPGAQIDGDERTSDARTTDAPEPQNGSQGQNREARYRVERNEARQERDSLAARIEALQIREVERIAGEHLAQPADLLSLGGVSLVDLVNADGCVDHDSVADLAAALIESRPGLAKNPRVLAVDPTQGSGGKPGKPAPTFADLLRQP
jgi:hypothetical protein